MVKATAMEALRRFWWIVVIFAVGGAVLGALPEPAKTADAQLSYRAVHVLLVKSDNGSIFADPIATNQLVLYTTTGEVPDRVAKRLNMSSGAEARGHISNVALDSSTGALSIEASDADAGRAEQIADTFAETLTSYLAELQQRERSDRESALLERSTQLEQDIKDTQAQLALKPDDRILGAQLDALSRQYSVVFEAQYGDRYNGTATLVLSTLQQAQAAPVSVSQGLGAPKSRTSRGALGLALGALLGAGVALGASRVDRRIRSRAHAELLFGGPASVVVPDVSEAGSGVAVRPERHDQLSDAYRTLRSVLAFSRSADPRPSTHRAAVILVVSPGSGEGKTSIAANLTAALTETNRRTIAVNSDFRRPTLTARLTGSPATPLPFTARELDLIPASDALRRTDDQHLVILDLAGIAAPPGHLARATLRMVHSLSEVADAIVIDSSPIGATAEVLELLPFADQVVVSIRLDHSLTSATQRTMQLLRSLTTGTLHLVVVGENIERSPYYEYGRKQPRRRRRQTVEVAAPFESAPAETAPAT